jgi:hypothetical protein
VCASGARAAALGGACARGAAACLSLASYAELMTGAGAADDASSPPSAIVNEKLAAATENVYGAAAPHGFGIATRMQRCLRLCCRIAFSQMAIGVALCLVFS